MSWPLDITVIPMFSDNLGFLGHDRESGATFAVDPGDAPAIRAALAERGWRLTHILNTHHHPDHVGGNLALKTETGCRIVGPAYDRARIPGLDLAVDEASGFSFAGHQARVLFTPGHTSGHIAYWFAEAMTLFCGDTLFSIGCGRLFEGSPAEMQRSLAKLRALPDATLVYCAHEYTEANCRFALTAEPENPDLDTYAGEVRRKRAKGETTIPVSLGREKRCNPFLRWDSPAIRRRFGGPDKSDAEIFAALRSAKDRF